MAQRHGARERRGRNGTHRTQERRPGEAAIADTLTRTSRALRAALHWSADATPDAYRVGAFARRHVLVDFPMERHNADPGWLQIPGTRTFALGLFVDRSHFVQLALADDRGRVFATGDPHADLQLLDPSLIFDVDKARAFDAPFDNADGADGADNIDGADGARARRAHRTPAVKRGRITAITDVSDDIIVGRWSKVRDSYTLESTRAVLPDALRSGLGYRDLVTVAFFACYLQPHMQGRLIPFGIGDLAWRLSRQAPLSAIHMAVRDEEETRMRGMRVSGLEEFATRLMREAGAFDDIPGLQPEHGAEPMHTLRSPYSGNYFLTWDAPMPFDAALTSLKIEGNLNRIAALRAWLDANAARGAQPTEETASAAEVASADRAFLRNPALVAFDGVCDATMFDDEGFGIVNDFPAVAQAVVHALAARYPDPVSGGGTVTHSEWIARQAIARLIRTIRLPYRFDCDMRMDIERGAAALAFTTAGPALMPHKTYDVEHGDWETLDDAQRARMSARYNLRVGLIIAALMFGVDERIDEVAIRIDSIGLEEAIAEQDNVIRSTISDALNAFERLSDIVYDRPGDKSDPKDGDRHGNPTRIIASASPLDPPRADDDVLTDGDMDTGTAHDEDFDALMRGDGIDEVTFAFDDIHPEPHPAAFDDAADAADADDVDEEARANGDGMHTAASSADAIERLRQGPTMRAMTTVTFNRGQFLARLNDVGLARPIDTYRMFDAALALDEEGALTPIEPGFSISDAHFSPTGAQDTPEEHDRTLDPGAARVLGADDTFGLAIQRDDLISDAVSHFHALASDNHIASAEKAQRAMALIERIGDPELLNHATDITSALIDGNDTPDFTSTLLKELDDARLKARDLVFSGRARQAIDGISQAVEALDDVYRGIDGVPRFFNSYADRIVYNRLFALPDERTVLIPDALFYAHLELADALTQFDGPEAALAHLNALVSYAPSYALTHLKLAIQLAQNEDWDSAKAACLNALRVSLDRGDASYAYYRLAQTAWMHDEFDVAYAAYMLSGAIGGDATPTRMNEMNEVQARAASQCIHLPVTLEDAMRTLDAHDIPVWPHTEVAPIVLDAARVCVDRAMFVPARILAVAAMRLVGDENDAVQMQFLRSLSA